MQSGQPELCSHIVQCSVVLADSACARNQGWIGLPSLALLTVHYTAQQLLLLRQLVSLQNLLSKVLGCVLQLALATAQAPVPDKQHALQH